MSASFSSTYAQFIAELKLTFPEYASALSSTCDQTLFSSLWSPYTAAVAARDGSIFTATGIPVVHGLTMTAALWAELGETTQKAIWNYISSLLLLSAAEKEGESLWDISGFKASLESMMKGLSEKDGVKGAPEGFASLFEKLASLHGGKDASGAKGIPGFKIPERLFKGQIAKIAEELVRDFKPEEFGIDPAMLESKDPAHVFAYLQEIFTRKPEMIMGAAQKIGKRLQAKFARGELNRDEIIREAEELMKEFSDNEAFSSLFGSLGEMFKGGEKESGNEGSLRRREVQERLRKKQAEKAAAKASAATTNTVSGMGGGATSAAELAKAAEEAEASLLAEEETSKPKRVSKK